MIMNTQAKTSKLAQRLVNMGLSRTAPEFPSEGIPMVQLAPWWRLWLREPRRNTMENNCAAVVAAIAADAVAFNQRTSLGQAALAALLPLFHPSTAVASLSDLIIHSSANKSAPEPTTLFSILEHLLRSHPPAVQCEIWKHILNHSLKKDGGFCAENDLYNLTLLETVGRSGSEGLAPLVSLTLGNASYEMVLAGITCLARLGAPNAALPAELLLNRIRPEMMEGTRMALAFVESGELDLLAGLWKTDSWPERLQVLRLVETTVMRKLQEGPLPAEWQDSLIDVLLSQFHRENDCDVIRCLAVTLGLALRGCESRLAEITELAALTNDSGHFECLMNALLLAEIPAGVGSQVEALRKQAVKLDPAALRALNRVLMSMGEPSGTERDWLDPQVVVLLQIGSLKLPDSISNWFENLGKCDESAMTALLLDKMDSGLTIMLCAAYLAEHPEYQKILEQIWVKAVYEKSSVKLQNVGGLLAGAVDDCAVSPAELRCCLGHEIGGPLEESPEMVGQLLALASTQDKDIGRSAEKLLQYTTASTRMITGYGLRWLERNQNPFDEGSQRWKRLGIPLLTIKPVPMLRPSLRPLFSSIPPAQPDGQRLLETLVLADKDSKKWARQCLDWQRPEVVEAALAPVDSSTLTTCFLQATASRHRDARTLGCWLAAGVGQRLLETPAKERILQRAIYLAAYDPSPGVRNAGMKAVRQFGIAHLIPANTPPPAPEPDEAKNRNQDWADPDMDELFQELMPVN